MNKKLSPLEAYKRFRHNIQWLEENVANLKGYFENEELCFKEDLDIIESALKNDDKEKFELIEQVRKLKDEIASLNSFNSKLWVEREEASKKLKAFEIFIKKMVNLDDLNDAIYEDSYHENNEHNAIDIYNQNRFEYKQLTQEEFDLLKEVLK